MVDALYICTKFTFRWNADRYQVLLLFKCSLGQTTFWHIEKLILACRKFFKKRYYYLLGGNKQKGICYLLYFKKQLSSVMVKILRFVYFYYGIFSFEKKCRTLFSRPVEMGLTNRKGRDNHVPKTTCTLLHHTCNKTTQI